MLPSDEYARRLGIRETQAASFQKLHDRVGVVRLLVAIVTFVAAWWSLGRNAFPSFWLLFGVAAFAGLVLFHLRVRRDRSRAERGAAFYRAGLARIEDRWTGTGQPGTRFEDPGHVYSADLDLFGKGGLFELLCTARTRMGEERLAHWLQAPAPVQVIRERQAGIAELAACLDLREDFAVSGDQSGPGVRPAALLQWAEAPNRLEGSWIRVAAVSLPLLAAATAVFWGISGIAAPFLLTVVIEAGALHGWRRRIAQGVQGSESAFEDIRLFSLLLMRIEREQFVAAPLKAVLARLSSHALSASHTLARLATIVSFAGARRNQAIALLAVPLMYPLHVALAAERWRRLHGRAVRSWIDAMGELEALLCLSAYRHEHPDDPFPELVEEGPACFEAAALGHPLIPAARAVRNDVSICGKTRILLVSGSNMSGKSTLLRSVGINTVLAMAGAPVRARGLRLTPLQVGASIRINDSLQEGSSRFYAEITRLRRLFDLAGGPPSLLFLLDELLQGTNSRDRSLGADAIVRALVARGAIGLVSTHDLALTQIRGLADESLRNVHFQDELLDGRMTFDFRLRDGVVTKSNALELMRSVGLEV